MSIVERLHRGVDTNSPPDITDSLMAEAADEIDRLRAALSAQLEAHNYAEVLEIARKALNEETK